MRPNFFPFAIAAILAMAPAASADPPFAGVAQDVRQRTGRNVAWQLDDADRQRARAEVRAALRRPLTLPVAVQIALLSNQGLQATFEEIGLSYADLRQARVVSNPEIDFAAKFPDRSPHLAKLEWSIAQDFINLATLPMRTRVARHQLRAAELRVADEVIRLVTEVKVAFVTLQADEAMLVRVREQADAQQLSLELARKLNAAGNLQEVRLVQEQAALSQIRLKVTSTEAEIREHREKLNRLLGLSGGETAWRLAGSLPAVPTDGPSWRNLETIAVANRLDLSAARADIDVASAALTQEKSWRFLPSFSLGVAGEREPDGTNLVGPMMKLPLPIFDTGVARVSRGESRVRQAERKMEQLSVNLQSEVRELRDRVISKRDMSRYYLSEVLPARRRILELTLKNYNAMIVGAFELFTARQELSEAELSHLTITRDYWIARAELERAVGGDLAPKSVDPKNSPRRTQAN